MKNLGRHIVHVVMIVVLGIPWPMKSINMAR
jgi:hypothetical protein